MPSHQERVRRNYPEGVRPFGAPRTDYGIGWNDEWGFASAAWNAEADTRAMAVRQARELERQGEAWFGHIPAPAATSEVPRPPLTATEPPAVRPSSVLLAAASSRAYLCPKCGDFWVNNTIRGMWCANCVARALNV